MAMNQKDVDDYNSGAMGNPYAPGYGQLGYQAHKAAHGQVSGSGPQGPVEPASRAGATAGLAALILAVLSVIAVYGGPDLVMMYPVYGWRLADIIPYETMDLQAVAMAYAGAFAVLWAALMVLFWVLRKVFVFLVIAALAYGGYLLLMAP